jgi:hypothetical protein
MPLIVIGKHSSTSGRRDGPAGTRNSETVNVRAVDVPPQPTRAEQADFCPHCRTPFEIISVKFKLSGVATIACCPNCAIAADWPIAKWEALNELKEFRAGCFELLGRGSSIMDPLSFRFRYFVAMLFVTVLIAGLFRHVFHVYGG